MINFIKKQFKKIIFFILGIGVCMAAPQVLFDDIPEEYKLKCEKEKILHSNEFEWKIYNEAGEMIEDRGIGVRYLYITDKKVETVRGEDISKRTKNAQFIKKGERDGNEEWTANFFAGEPFYKDGTDWYQTETATTTIDAFKKQTKKISWLPFAYADSSTIYSGAGDGTVAKNNSSSWNTTHDATTGAWASHTGTIVLNISKWWGTASDYYLGRGFFPIDTSGLPDDANISAAVFNLVVDSVYADNAGTRSFALVQTDQPSNTALTTADYNNCGAINNPTEGASRITVTTTGAKTFTLNSTGRGWISKTGYTKLGIRTGWLDCDDTQPTDGSQEGEISFRSSEYANTTSDPYLEITYTTGGADRRIIIIE